ncbi:MAG: Na/Pi symporter, partial [Opitutales bacterium]
LELLTGFLTKLAVFCANLFQDAGGMRLSNPLKEATEPTIELLAIIAFQHPVALLIITITLTYGMLIGIVKLLRSMVLVKVEKFFDEFLFKTWGRAMVFGFILTVMVQSSTIPTSAIIPLAAAGILRLLQIYPFSLGCNLGTTITAMLAALATASELAITVAFSHLLFNISGILLIWSIPPIRRIPVHTAEWIAARSLHNRWIPIGIIASIFFLIPLLFILINQLI